MHLGVLEVLEVDRDAFARVASFDVMSAIGVVKGAASLHDVGDILVLLGVDNCGAVGLSTGHFLRVLINDYKVQ